MWPSKAGLGVQLSYGLEGSAINLSETNAGGDEALWKLSRVRNGGITLHKIGHSRKTLVPSQIQKQAIQNETTTTNLSTVDAQKNEVYVPQGLYKTLMNESNNLLSRYILDPSIGQLFDTGVVKTPTRVKQTIAYVGDETGTTAHIAVIVHRNEVVTGSQNTAAIRVPRIARPYSLKLPTPIKQVQFPKLAVHMETTSPYLAIRTESDIYILKLTGSRGDLEIQLVGSFTTAELESENFADVAFNPWDITQFGVIDVKGNFGVWNIKEKNFQTLQRVELSGTSIQDTTVLSCWKRIMWSFDFNSVFVMSRAEVVNYSIKTQERTTIITANTWSTIMDFKRCVNNDSHAFILTSQELIFVLLKGQIKRLVSWKHYLDSSDPSLRLSIPETHVSSHILVTIYSQTHPLVFVYQFSFQDGLPVSIQDPFYLNRDSDTASRTLVMLPAEDTSSELGKESYGEGTKVFALLSMSTELELSLAMYSTEPLLSVVSSKRRQDSRESTPDEPVVQTSAKRYFPRVTVNGLWRKSQALFGNLDDVDSYVDNSADVDAGTEEAIQDYAYRLGLAVTAKTTPGQTVSLSQLVEPPRKINHIEELQSMVDQFKEHYASSVLEFSDIATYAHLFSGAEAESNNVSSDMLQQRVSTMTELYRELSQVWCIAESADPELRRETAHCVSAITKSFGLSLISVTHKIPPQAEEETLQRSIDRLPLKLKELILEWDEEGYEEEPMEDFTDERFSQRFANSFTPMINVSQKLQSSQSLPSRRVVAPRTSSSSQVRATPVPRMHISQGVPTTGFSQSNPLFVPSQSQVAPQRANPPSQGGKKKKRKKGGFA
ncbi:hypothetical protein BABINDRAFT_161955 [Babjeviella inositovora NRRL Y-12698]|uniref:RNA polymerase I-specific transcription initiation factor RRN6-like protein n=1 Tax=Babjeviella inositovora NRRL Y-12698 TaxID=984486 RepID=A0A1E3QPD5_9ASCO|nr:uncharacterized protein BABINDRAFT_161955 [Babjeviella inositovora NRRL Y-12698]ODQ79569.1 hypothetical protein BABINDRAFT_161955 [Babjeviella inositovora NRRL Y-12698]